MEYKKSSFPMNEIIFSMISCLKMITFQTIVYCLVHVIKDIFELKSLTSVNIPGFPILEIVLFQWLFLELLLQGFWINKKIRISVRNNYLYIFGLYWVEYVLIMVKDTTGFITASIILQGWGLYLLSQFSLFIDMEEIFNDYEDEDYLNSLLSDMPVSNHDYLVNHLRIAVNEIERVIDSVESDIPFVFSIDGDWGSGKTSVLASVTNKLLSRGRNEKQYFILKIDTILFKTNDEIIKYVDGSKFYFYLMILTGMRIKKTSFMRL